MNTENNTPEVEQEEPTNKLEKLLKDVMTLLAGDAAEAINAMIEKCDEEDSSPHLWSEAEDRRKALVDRIDNFLTVEFKQSAVVVVDGGVASLEFLPPWMAVKIEDRDVTTECLNCGEYCEEDPCEYCGHSNDEDWEDEDD